MDVDGRRVHVEMWMPSTAAISRWAAEIAANPLRILMSTGFRGRPTFATLARDRSRVMSGGRDQHSDSNSALSSGADFIPVGPRGRRRRSGPARGVAVVGVRRVADGDDDDCPVGAIETTEAPPPATMTGKRPRPASGPRGVRRSAVTRSSFRILVAPC
jgi:hypothetical protein